MTERGIPAGAYLLAAVWLRIYRDRDYPRARVKLRVLEGAHRGAAVWVTLSLDLRRPGVAVLLGTLARAIDEDRFDVGDDAAFAELVLGRPFRATVVVSSGRYGTRWSLGRVEVAPQLTEAERAAADGFRSRWLARRDAPPLDDDDDAERYLE